jgi:hypothetical protein
MECNRLWELDLRRKRGHVARGSGCLAAGVGSAHRARGEQIRAGTACRAPKELAERAGRWVGSIADRAGVEGELGCGGGEGAEKWIGDVGEDQPRAGTRCGLE